MLKYTLAYLWIYIGIHGLVQVVNARDAEEHVHIKLHMPKTGIRKSVHRNHIRHKKNPPPYRHAPPPPPPPPTTPYAHGPTSVAVSGPATAHHSSHMSAYHETPHHNYLTAMGDTNSMHSLPPHHIKNAMTHFHTMDGTTTIGAGGGHQQMLDAQFFASADGGIETTGDGGDDYVAYLTKNFASFPQPTYETEIISSPNSDLLAYHQAHGRESEEELEHQHMGINYHGQHYAEFKHSQLPSYKMAEASVVAAQNHELEEDNEILAPMGRTSAMGGAGVLTTKKALKNEHHLLRHAMQHQQLYMDADNNQDDVMSSPAVRPRSRNHYRYDKLHTESLENAPGSGAMDAMNTYEDLDMEAAVTNPDKDPASRYNDGGIKPLTVDDIWSQLQRTYLDKYTPKAQSNEMHTLLDEEEKEETDRQRELDDQRVPQQFSRKQKRNSQKIKTKQRAHQTGKVASTSSPGRILGHEQNNNYYNREHHGKPSTFYDSHTPQTAVYSASFKNFSPYAYSYSSSSSSPSTYVISSTKPSYQNFKTFSNFDETAATHEQQHSAEDEEEFFAANDDVSSEESPPFSSSHKKGNKHPGNRSHRHSHGHAAYGHADTLNSNPFNYHDLHASYSTPVAQATLATHPNYEASTYHPSSFKIIPATPSSNTPSASALLYPAFSSSLQHQQEQEQEQELELEQQQQSPQSVYSTGHESTSYQWREQQHVPASYQSYHTSSSHKQQQLQQPYTHYHTQQYQPQASNALHLPKATVASASAASSPSSASLSHHRPLAISSSSPTSLSSPSSSSPPLSQLLTTNDFTSAVKQSSTGHQQQLQQQHHQQQQHQQQQQQQQRNKKRKNRLKSKRNRIVVI